MTPAPKRRWFRWSLRTMFVVVTVFGCWLGYELNWIRQRHDVLAHPNVAASLFAGDDDPFADQDPTPVSPPWPLRVFGEKGVAGIHLSFKAEQRRLLSKSEEAELNRTKKLFPEANVTAGAFPADTRVIAE